MKWINRILLLSIVGLAIPGCSESDSESAPPVMQALDEMARLDAMKAEQELAKARKEALARMEAKQAEKETELLQTGSDSENVDSVYEVEFDTTVGKFTIEVHRAWAPIGAQRFYELVKVGFYDDCAFFRVLEGFMCQVGMAADPVKHGHWHDNNIPDDPVIKSNTRGYVTFAKTQFPNSRSTQIFINYGNNASNLDPQGFAPFGRVKSGMSAVSKIYSGHRQEPDQGQIRASGNAYLRANFPGLTYIKTARVTVDDLAEDKPATDSTAAETDKSSPPAATEADTQTATEVDSTETESTETESTETKNSSKGEDAADTEGKAADESTS